MSIENPTKINPIVAEFLRHARNGDAEKAAGFLKKDAQLIDSIEAGGFSALHFAAAYGHKALMLCLLEHKPTIDLANYDSNTPLMLAARHNQPEMAVLLMDAGANVNYMTPGGSTALHHAAKLNNLDLMKMLMSRGAKAGAVGEGTRNGSLLHWAVDCGKLSMLGFLVYTAGVPIDTRDEHGGTALFHACASKQHEAVQFLLDNGADPNAAAKGNSTPLHIATALCGLDTVRLLMEYGADPAAKDQDGESPLDIATAAGKKNFVAALNRTPPSDPAKRDEQAARFKENGNKAFANGENNKAFKFYSAAIALTPKNHVLFSNRSACNYNCMDYNHGWLDAQRCVDLKPDWPKGYLRLAANLRMLKRFDEAVEACRKGLALDSSNSDMKKLLDDIRTAMGLSTADNAEKKE